MATLPLLLAGPIVRRVDTNQVSIFVALSQNAQVEIRLWAGRQMSSGAGTVSSGNSAIATAQAQTRRIAKNLWIAIVTVTRSANPAMILAPGSLVSYDVLIQPTGSAPTSLRGENLLTDLPAAAGGEMPGQKALGYDTNRLPSFVMPAATIDNLRIAHASCRKPHAGGYDAMAWLDDYMRDNKDDHTKWPQQLFLTGDQIYADDVAVALLPMLTHLGIDLLGGAERFPINESAEVDVTLSMLPPQRRGKLVRVSAGMTSTDANSHLLGFGEFAAMYLAAWSPRVWRALGTPFQTFVQLTPDNAASQSVLSRWEDCFAGNFSAWQTNKTRDVEEQTNQLKVYRDAVPKVGRALANCATYMIFDDHEVTDDWNLNGRWQSRVYSKKPGKAIIRNGLMAYGVFQGWGNDPDAFKTGNNKDFLDQVALLFAGDGPFPAAPLNRIEELCGFPGAAADKQAAWHYRVDGPRHRVVVLNTRTRRGLEGPLSLAAPKLLGSTLNQQLPDGPLTDGRELLLLVSPAPVLGPGLFDRLLQPLAQTALDVKNVASNLIDTSEYDPCKQLNRTLSQVEGPEHFDAEGWAANEEHQEALLKKLAGYGRAVILSGDVHFGCSLSLEYWRAGASSTSSIVQFTSSAAHNEWPLSAQSAFRSNAMLQDYQRGIVAERLGWNGAAKITVTPGAHIGPGRRARMKRSPALLPAAGWPTGTVFSDAAGPNWRWRMYLGRDQRPAGTPGAPAAPPPLPGGDLNPASSFNGYRDLAKRHAVVTMGVPRLLRQMIFANNVALVNFKVTGSEITVVQQLLSAATVDAQTYALNTLHEHKLGPSGELPPIPIASP
jgi:hypothetical protein